MPFARYLNLGTCCAFLAACASSSRAEAIHAGPLFDEFSLTLTEGSRTEAIGPLFYFDEQPGRRQWSIPPLCSHTWYTDVDAEEIDILYPLITFDRYGGDYRWQFGQVVNSSGGPKQNEGMVQRFYLFPLYFQQRSPNPAQNYTAVFPFYGTITRKFSRDEIHFVMFPLYSQTRKRDVVTDNYLFPLFHLRSGDGLRGWQFWPIYGAEHKTVTTRTNIFGTVETVVGHDQHFALWPILFWEHNGLGGENPQTNHVFLPFYNLSRSPQRDVSSYVWPLFNYTDDREKKYREWDFPWPLWVIARGEGKTITRFIPIYSWSHTADMDSESILWPLLQHRYQHSPDLVRDRWRVAFWLYSRVDQTNIAAGTSSRRTDCWPLFTHYRGHDGNTRLQILAPIEPILPNTKSIERNWSPLWSLWRSEKNATTGDSFQSLLWNLYRRSTTLESKKCSLLFGLFQYQSGTQGKQLRLFFIPFGKLRATVPSAIPPVESGSRPAH